MKLYFVRHGQTDSNAQANNRPDSGTEDGLNELGVQQVNELAEELKEIQFDAIISSPLERCRQTADIINKYHNLTIITDTDWQEIHTNGYVDMQTWSDLFHFGTKVATNNVEPLKSFFERIYKAIQMLIQNNADKNILVVSHGGVQLAVYAYANELPLEGNIRISPMRNAEYRIYTLGKTK
ncbi:MAG: histidine phosphatase family protein [Candidatus Saccharimonadaceae bacterium]